MKETTPAGKTPESGKPVLNPKPTEPIPADLLYLVEHFADEVQRCYRDFTADAREERRSEIVCRLVVAANKAHEVFDENAGMAYGSHLWRALNWAALKYCRTAKRAIRRMDGVAILSLDVEIDPDGGDGETFADAEPDPDAEDATFRAIDRMDFDEILAELRKRNPYFAHVVDLVLQDLGDDFVAKCLGVKKRSFQESLWPKVKTELRKVADFLSGNRPAVG